MRAIFCFLPIFGLLLCSSSRAIFDDDDDASSSHHRILQELPPGVAPEIGILLTIVGALDLELVNYETPITLRFTNYFTILFWNCVAVYDDAFLAADTNERPPVPSLIPGTFTSINRAICAAQAAVTYSGFSLPPAVPGTVEALAGIGVAVDPLLDPAIAACDATSAAAAALTSEQQKKLRAKQQRKNSFGDTTTSDAAAALTSSCLQAVARSRSYDPITMGQIVALLAYQSSLNDGWNQDGTIRPNGLACSYNCRNYSDTTGFAPQNSPYDMSEFNEASSDRWQPLLEDSGKGFFFYQEHVTPHIGKRAAFRYLPETERATRVASPPDYTAGRRREMKEVLRRMADLDDNKKMQVEAFDDKLVVANAVFGAFLGKVLSPSEMYVDTTELGHTSFVLSYERLVHFVAGYIATEYDSVIIAWKEKVRYDLIRPTSAIKRWREDGGGGDLPTTISTWVPFRGTQTFLSTDFEAYKRVMPHSEYVSGSSCLFRGIEEYVTAYLAKIGLSPTFPVTIGPFPQGSSSVEPNLTPADELTLTYETIADMAEAGSQSRLDGGMHFGAAVPAGQKLCSGIAKYTVDGIFNLIGG